MSLRAFLCCIFPHGVVKYSGILKRVIDMAKKSSQRGALASALLMVLVAFIWGTSFVAQSKGLDKIGNFTFLAFRSYLAVIALFPLAFTLYKKDKSKELEKSGENKGFFSKELLIGGALCGGFLFAGTAFQQVGIMYSGVGKSGFLTALYILIVPLIGIFFKKKIKPLLWICIGIALFGMYLLCSFEGGRLAFGDIMLIVCAFCFAAQIMTVDKFVVKVDGVRLSLVQFGFCAIFSTVAMLVFEEISSEAVLSAWFSIFYAGVMSSGVGYTLQIVAQKKLNPVVAGLLMSLESVFAALSGAVFGERLKPEEIAGCCLVFAAIILAQLPEKNKKARI